MSEEIKKTCEICNGQKRILGLGCIMQTCHHCAGSGFVIELNHEHELLSRDVIADEDEVKKDLQKFADKRKNGRK